METIALTINGRAAAGACAHRTHLGDFLRDGQGLTGTHLGCEHGVCGACTVLVDDQPVRSCITFAAACAGSRVVTIEGYDDDPVMRSLRLAFNRHHALQCGYCTPGMLATARDIVLRLPEADEATIRNELSGNLCRCTGYMGIVAAIRSVLAERRPQGASPEAIAPAGLPASPREFACFAPAEDSLGDQAPADAGAKQDVERASDKKGWSRIDGAFTVPFPAADVWRFMADLPAVAGCLPGAALTEHDGDRVKGHVAIKFGPMSARFNGAARLERDDQQRRGVLKGAGQDSLSNSKAAGDIAYQVRELTAGTTEVAIDLQYSLQGPLAQFSRSGLVRDFVRRMMADFGKNVTRRMDPSLSDSERSKTSQMNPVAMMLGVMWDRAKRLFSRTGQR